MNISGKQVLITGGGSGIGRALAQELHRRGNTVTICGRREALLKETAAKFPGLKYYTCDISSPAALKSMIQKIKKAKRTPSVLINNAAVLNDYTLGDPKKMDIAQMKKDISINLFGPAELTNLLLPDLLAAPDPMIVNIGSPVGIAPLAKAAVYSSSKAALHSYTQSLRYCLKGKVKVIEVFPPVVATAMSPKIRKEMPPEEFALKMLGMIGKGKDEVWIGDAKVLKILQRMKPGKVVDIVNDYNEK